MGLAGVGIFALTLLIFNSRTSEGLPLVHSEDQSVDSLPATGSPINKREIQIETGSIQISGAADGVNSTSVRIVYGQPAVTNQPSKSSSKNNWRQRRYSDMLSNMDTQSQQEDIMFSNDEDNLQEDISDYDNIIELDNLQKRMMTPNSSPSLDSFVAMRGKKRMPRVPMSNDLLVLPQSVTKNSFRSKRKQPDLDTFFAMRGRKRRTPFHNKGHIGDIFIGMRG